MSRPRRLHDDFCWIPPSLETIHEEPESSCDAATIPYRQHEQQSITTKTRAAAYHDENESHRQEKWKSKDMYTSSSWKEAKMVATGMLDGLRTYTQESQATS